MTTTPATNVFFLCPHGAAKSVYAVSRLLQLADERGLAIDAANAGTDPDDRVLPLVQDHLAAEGMVAGQPPRPVRSEHLAPADLIISIGCDHEAIPTDKPIIDWAIPNFSADPPAAFAALDRHVQALIDSIAADQPS